MWSKRLLTMLLISGTAATTAMMANTLPAGTKTSSTLGVEVENIYREGSDIVVQMQIDLSRVNMKSNVETVYTPMFVNGTDTVRLQSFAIAGRNRKYWDERNNAMTPATFYKKKLLPESMKEHKGHRPAITVTPAAAGSATGVSGLYDIRESTLYRDWMETAMFTIDVENIGCANCIKDVDGIAEEGYPLAQNDFVQRSFFPEFLYVTPVAEAIKMREISARAYIDFVVNRIEINPTYRRNPEELAKIRATIDSVKNDKDIKITALHINGTASPEGSYENNVRLAKGRTESLKDYVQGLYRFPAGFITTSFEPVDWEGLANFLQMVVMKGIEVADVQQRPDQTAQMDSIRYDQFQNINFDLETINETLPHAANILAIVDSNIEPYARNKKIQTGYPAEYDWLLKNVYPALRHSDYRIQFEVKTYTEVSEILEVMATKPQNLSLAELFVAANSQEPGSELYTQAFELAVTMYPEDETANLNAAVAAMQRGDLIQAQRYLSKVNQETAEADYAKAMLLLLQGDEPAAYTQLTSLSNSLNTEVAAKARKAVEGLDEVRRSNERKFIKIN